MRYATWELNWQPDSNYGTGPESIIAERGGSAEGAFFVGTDPHDTIVGYVYGDVSLVDLDAWSVTEVTNEQALTMAQDINPAAMLDPDGRIVYEAPIEP